MRHLIEPTDLSVDETERIIDLALDIIAHRQIGRLDQMTHNSLRIIC